jgi:anti-sigma factor RsiW
MKTDYFKKPPTRPPIADETIEHFPNVVGRDGNVYLSCAEVISFLFEYLSEDLAASRRFEFERHLARCASCRDYLATYRETIVLAQGVFAADEPALVELPPDLYQAILAAT